MPETELITFGPFEIPTSKIGRSRRIEATEISEFKKNLKPEGLEKKQGCYLFCIRAGKGFTPYYVGRTQKGTLPVESTTSDKIRKYNKVLNEIKKGTPVMFFIAKSGSKNVLNNAVCADLETTLIAIAKEKNSDLLNIQNTKKPKWFIRGVLGGRKRKPSEPQEKLKTALGL